MMDYFSHIPILHLETYCIIIVGDAGCTNQLEKENKQNNNEQMVILSKWIYEN